ncbi:MAG: hypothetical protein K8I60_01260 [Anaerolineae bacterium]|nr:hypothetical protein [Anaerolineae bacterium]
MTYLNEQQRGDLQKELKNMTYDKAKWKLRRMDKDGEMVFYRNAQGGGRWLTRFDLPTLGVRVTLAEIFSTRDKNHKLKAVFDYVDAVVEPLGA